LTGGILKKEDFFLKSTSNKFGKACTFQGVINKVVFGKMLPHYFLDLDMVLDILF